MRLERITEQILCQICYDNISYEFLFSCNQFYAFALETVSESSMSGKRDVKASFLIISAEPPGNGGKMSIFAFRARSYNMLKACKKD